MTKLTLLPHQLVGRDFLVKHERALLADGMRVGKSIQSIAACDELQPLGVVVICPASLRTQWGRQFQQFSSAGVAPIVFSYEEAVKRKSALAASDIDALLIDESHYLKNRKSQRTKAVFGEIAPRAKRVWCLTGTPSPNNASELWPMLRALFPQVITDERGKPMDYWRFTKRFCKVVTTPFGEKIEGNRNTDELKRRMAPIMLRRPSSILGGVMLPPEDLYLDVAASELKRLERELRAELGEQIYRADPAALDAKVKARIGRLTGLAKVPALAQRLKDEFESGLDKVVVFGWHTDVLDALAIELRDYDAVVAHGKISTAQRDRNVERFQTSLDCRAILANIKAEGVGRDYSAACETVFIERSWVPGDNEQAAKRVTGVNQHRPTRARYAVLPGGWDERLMSVNVQKSRDIAELFE